MLICIHPQSGREHHVLYRMESTESLLCFPRMWLGAYLIVKLLQRYRLAVWFITVGAFSGWLQQYFIFPHCKVSQRWERLLKSLSATHTCADSKEYTHETAQLLIYACVANEWCRPLGYSFNFNQCLWSNPCGFLKDAAQLHVGCIMLTTKINHENS